MSREQEIFNAALDRSSEIERAAFLEAACAGAPEMRARIDALLRAAESAGGFLEDAHAPIRETSGSRIGRYLLRDKIGEGGFGVIYLAEQQEPVRRDVALKIIKLGMDTRAVVARFEAERQALAMMEHPNIARVLDAGATDAGRPYFVMELVRGVPVTEYCRGQRVPLRGRLELFLQVCRAVHHAHQKGVIHRDLKPANILISEEDGRPSAKVIDFGIAKAMHEPLTEKTLLTRLHAFIGTPAYMSPEQVGLGDIDVDTRSDIYSLGALLYELLADEPLLDAQALLKAGYAAVQRAIHHTEPVPPSQRVAALCMTASADLAANRRANVARIVADLRGDLDRIVLKCLEKDRARRYETTEDLARDIERHLRNEPVLARPATFGYRAAKFVRRHRRSVSVAALGVAVIATLGIYHGRRLATERDRARTEAQKAAKVSEFLTEILTTADPFRDAGAGSTNPHALLEATAARVREEFPAQPLVRAEILNAIGRVYLRRGEHAKALPVLTEALAAGRAIGRPDPRLAQTLSDLGILHRERGDFNRARPLLEEALAVRRTLHPADHNDVAISVSELGRLESALDRLDRAEVLFREALAIRRRVFSGDHREVATSLGDLGMLLWQKGEFDEAESCVREGIGMHARTVTTNHPNYAQSVANLALIRIERGALDEAEALTRESLAIFRRGLDERHWRVLRIRGQLGGLWQRQGRLAEAAVALDETMTLAKSSLGNEHALLAALRVERARVHLGAGEPIEAEALLREALRAQGAAHAADGWRVAATKSLLGAALLAQGRVDDAEPWLLAAARVLPDVRGPRGRETKPTQERLAVLARLRLGGGPDE